MDEWPTTPDELLSSLCVIENLGSSSLMGTILTPKGDVNKLRVVHFLGNLRSERVNIGRTFLY